MTKHEKLGNAYYAILCKNTEKWEDVICYQAGLWNKSTYLIIENEHAEKSGFTVKEVSEETPNSIRAISIEQIMAQQKLDSIDILKIDIEGSEKEVFLSNYENWLPKTRVTV